MLCQKLSNLEKAEMIPAQEKEMYDMVKAIYNHLGIDGSKPVDINERRKQAEKDVLKFAEKRKKKIGNG